MGHDDSAATSGPAPDLPPPASPDRLRMLLVVAVALLVVGAVVTVVLVSRPVEFAWSTHAPVTEASFSPGVVVLRPGVVWSVLAVSVGAVLISGVVGYRLGRRDGARGARPSSR